jgi:hypothetical protein
MSRKVDATQRIEDDFGEEHDYYVTMHPAGEGFRLLVRLTRIIGGMLGRAWGALSPSDVGEKMAEVASMLDQGIDGEGVAQAFERLSQQILDEGGDVFVRDILRHTARDGQKLSSAGVFDAAYMGNYGELFGALYFVLKVNFGPFFAKRLGGSTGGVAGILDRATAKLQTLSAPRVPSG